VVMLLGSKCLRSARGGFDIPCELESVGAGLLLDRENDRGIAHVAGLTALYSRRKFDCGELAQGYGDAFAIGDGQVLDITKLRGASEITDEVFAGMLIDEAAGGIRPELAKRKLNLVARDIETCHLSQVEGHSVLPYVAADRDHLGDARDSEQARSDQPVDQLTHVHEACFIAGDRNQHDLTHNGGDRRHLRVDVARQSLADDVDPFGNLLTIEVDARAPIELDVYDR
jgi:hypothetical protein